MLIKMRKKMGILIVLLAVAFLVTGCIGEDPTDSNDEKTDYIKKSVSNVEELEKTLNNLGKDDKAIITLRGGPYENDIVIDERYEFSEISLKAYEEHDTKISGTFVLDNIENVTISDFLIEGSYDGIDVKNGSKNINITNNVIRDQGYFGL
ncbi:MAG: hypothetical protein ACOC1O_05055, partial [bacterium]